MTHCRMLVSDTVCPFNSSRTPEHLPLLRKPRRWRATFLFHFEAAVLVRSQRHQFLQIHLRSCAAAMLICAQQSVTATQWQCMP